MNGRFSLIEYQNGTTSIVDRECDQAMHSRVGPWAEANILYAESSHVAERLISSPHSKVVLWDVGMGTGANAIAAMEAIRKSSQTFFRSKCVLKIESFENALDGIRFALQNRDKFPYLAGYETKFERLLNEGAIPFELENGIEIDWKLHIGDFFSQLENAEIPNLIYYDFYSPKAAPGLWTKERFRAIREKCGDKDVRLYTYSAATPVRLAMLLGGFFVGYGPGTGMKSESTIATTTFDALENPLGREWIEKLRVSSAEMNCEDRKSVGLHPLFLELNR